ncbi:hypothetical protein PAMP_021587 [Pampus punctatissimus]
MKDSVRTDERASEPDTAACLFVCLFPLLSQLLLLFVEQTIAHSLRIWTNLLTFTISGLVHVSSLGVCVCVCVCACAATCWWIFVAYKKFGGRLLYFVAERRSHSHRLVF